MTNFKIERPLQYNRRMRVHPLYHNPAIIIINNKLILLSAKSGSAHAIRPLVMLKQFKRNYIYIDIKLFC